MASDDDGSGVVGSVNELMEVAGSTWPICYSRTGNRHDADEAVSEVRVWAYEAKDKLLSQPKSAVRAQAMTVATRRSIDIVRRRGRQAGLSGDIQDAADKLVPMSSRSTCLDSDELLSAFVLANASDPELSAAAEYLVQYAQRHGDQPTSTEIGNHFFGHLKRAQRFKRAERVQTLLYLNTIRFLQSRGIELPRGD